MSKKINLEQIDAALIPGDYKLIEQMVGCDYDYVRMVMHNKRSHRRGKGKRIVEAAQLVRANRKQLIKDFKSKEVLDAE